MHRLNLRSSTTFISSFRNHIKGRFIKRESVDGERSYSHMQSNYQIRNITEADIPRIAEIRKTVKLHDCISSLYTIHKLDPKSIFVAEDDEGHIIGTHLMISYAKGLYISGLTYVHHNYRKNNLAMEIIHKAIARHKDNLLICYAYAGWARRMAVYFRFEIGFIVKRYISSDDVDLNLLSDDLRGNVVIHPFEEKHLDLMNDYDLKVASYERRRYLELSFHEPNSKTLIALKNGQCVGFGSIKLSCSGAKRVGPLYAEDPRIAEALLKSLLKGFYEGKGVVIVVPSPNLEAQKLVNKLNIPLNDELQQLHDKSFPEADVNKAYALFDVNGASI